MEAAHSWWSHSWERTSGARPWLHDPTSLTSTGGARPPAWPVRRTLGEPVQHEDPQESPHWGSWHRHSGDQLPRPPWLRRQRYMVTGQPSLSSNYPRICFHCPWAGQGRLFVTSSKKKKIITPQCKLLLSYVINTTVFISMKGRLVVHYYDLSLSLLSKSQ